MPLTGPSVDAANVTLAVAAVGEVMPLAEDVHTAWAPLVLDAAEFARSFNGKLGLSE
mgnify:CR=1 FL=1